MMAERAPSQVVAVETIGPYTLLRVRRGFLDPGIPGQFFMLEAPGRPLPRPMSVCVAPPGELGFLIDPIVFWRTITGHFLLVLGVVGALVIGKGIAAEIAGRAFAYSRPARLTMWSLTLPQVAATLAPGGHFVLDYLNAEYVRRTLNVIEQTTSEDVLVTRRIDSANRFVIKEIELRAEGRRFQERVRLYGAEELVELLTDAGLQVTARFGNYDGAAAGPATPRVILVAARS